MEKRDPNEKKYLNCLLKEIETLTNLEYFNNIKKYPLGSFLFGSYNLSSVIKEHNLHIAITTTKTQKDSEIKILSKILCENMNGNDGKSNVEKFEEFLLQFKDKNYSDTYYKKFAAILPIDKLSNELCQIILEKNTTYILASLATFELVMAKIATKFNMFGNELIRDTNFNNLDTNQMEKNGVELFDMVKGENENDVKNAIIEVIELFKSFFNEINEQFYCD